MNILFALIRLSLGDKLSLSHSLSDAEWYNVYKISQQHAIDALLIEGLDKIIIQGYKLPPPLLYEWIGLSEQVRHRNSLLNRRCVDLAKHFEKAGFKSCILKGQGNARMYPNPERRSPGDIDIWVDASKKEIVDYIHSRYPETNVAQHHVDFPMFDDVNVEVHYLPTYSITLRYQKRLDAYIEENRDRQFNHSIILPDCNESINVPTNDFNIIHQLTHLERHFFYGGIGLRQIIDFYCLLCCFPNIWKIWRKTI